MPELPEVETIRLDLDRLTKNLRITDLQLLDRRALQQTSARKFYQLKGKQIKQWDRIGKLMIVELASPQLFLLIHLKMTGQLIYRHNVDIIPGGHGLPDWHANLPNKYTIAYFSLSNGSQLFFNDMRRFAYLRVATKTELHQIKNNFGPDAISPDFSLPYWLSAVSLRKAPIKNILLNQKILAGIGNIYADEICFRARIKPTRKANKLTKQELTAIFRAIKQIMPLAIKHRGTTFSDYLDAHGQRGGFVKLLKVYGRAGKKCKRCQKGVIKKVKLGGRGTHFCPFCQI